MGFSASTSSFNILRVELLAILYGLRFAVEGGFRKLICETDCLEAFLDITSTRVSQRHRCVVLIQEIKLVMLKFDEIRFTHVLRSGNTCDDHMAHVGATAGLDWVKWEGPSNRLCNLMMGDISQFGFFLFVFFFFFLHVPKKKISQCLDQELLTLQITVSINVLYCLMCLFPLASF